MLGFLDSFVISKVGKKFNSRQCPMSTHPDNKYFQKMVKREKERGQRNALKVNECESFN